MNILLEVSLVSLVEIEMKELNPQSALLHQAMSENITSNKGVVKLGDLRQKFISLTATTRELSMDCDSKH